MSDVADCRDAFAAAAEVFSGPLYRHWCALAAAEAGPDDRTFTAFAPYGLDFANWQSAQRLLRATSEELRSLGPSRPLAAYFPVLHGTLPPDGRSYQLWTELLRDRRGPIGRRLQERPLPLNDPQSGVRMLRLVTEHLRDVYADPVTIDLVAVGAAAGLELVADAFEPELLAGQRIASRRGYDLYPLHPGHAGVLDRMLSQLEPEQVAAQARVRRAVRLVDEQDIVVSRRDAFDVVSAEGFGFGRLPVVFGSSFLCMVDDRARMDELMRARHAEGIWVADESVGVLRSVSEAAVLRDAAPTARATRLAHYRAGELLAETVRVE
ncbi:hypothetical protein GCM10011492_14230 [Flexivirga endophytica]|uniref:DUF2332 family protein n=1 Tax=Flexivirga endophytica TaxID=1849103 RepID=A0A916T058_9MICO|nr:DUF2332 family protein [Flexivirga endophytica]GGB25338.1 hypothetical protein GCM10011492_14230 [Flexivirga endophytica]GHB53897.1 hypothetical protein GCM10008112_23550 [Flexivirga endophytica]